ncbi:MAG TPA: hypothetical protein VF895_02485 [Gaiellaceae bacterium]
MDAGSATLVPAPLGRRAASGRLFVFVGLVCLRPGNLVGIQTPKGGQEVSVLWIILIVVLVLALMGFFSRGYW